MILGPRYGMTNNLKVVLGNDVIQRQALPANLNYGLAIYEGGAVEMINQNESYAEAWVGGLDGSVKERGGGRRRTQLFIKNNKLAWHCAGNCSASN